MKRLFLAFGANRSGNFGVVAAFAAVPLVMAAGMGLDLASITSAKSKLHNATDAAALAIAREGTALADPDARKIAASFVEGNFDPVLTNLSVKRAGTAVTVSAETQSQMTFGGLFGYRNWPVKVASTADIALTSYEIALSLDTTGSMAGGKLASLQDAVVGLIDTMSDQIADPQKLKFALVPFAQYVNVGPSNGPAFDKAGVQVPGTGAKWLDLDGISKIPQMELEPGASRFQVYNNLNRDWPGCVETRYDKNGDLDVTDQAPDPADPATLFVPAFAIDEPDTSDYGNSYVSSTVDPKDKSVSGKKTKQAKYGILTDSAGKPKKKGKGLKVTIDATLSLLTGKPKGPEAGCDVQPLTTLTTDYDGIKKKVNALKASGNTNILEGVSWGWRVLSPGEPFTEGQAQKPGLQKILILLTDGSNVFGNANNALGSVYSSFGYLTDGRLGITAGGTSQTNSVMNDKTLQACANAKAAGIEIFTIRLEEPNVATGSMLSECASGPDHYFDTPSRAQLDATFGKIREKITKVRIAA